MTTVKILLAPAHRMHEFFCNSNATDLALDMYAAGLYEQAGEYVSSLEGEDAAEDAFCLTNNPDRQEERVRVYGRHRSVSTGDVIIVGGDAFLCASSGWEKL